MSCRNNHQCRTCPRPCSIEVHEVEYGKLWSSLTMAEKEMATGAKYPANTRIWNSWSRDEREAIVEKYNLRRNRGNKNTALGHDF